ncbi:MAG: hypothetical protein V3576_03040 [Candidatus Cloacimonadota bacterium]
MVNPRALIDLGSNSIKCLIYEAENRKILLQYVKVGALAEARGPDRSLHPLAIARNLDILKHMVQRAKKHNCSKIDVFGTAALREAPNAGQFCQSFREDTGIQIHLLSPTEEAELSFMAAAENLKGGSGLVFDIGGASLELSQGRSNKLVSVQSLKLGALVLSNDFLGCYPCPDEDYQALDEHLENCLKAQTALAESEALVGVGGTVSTLAALLLGVYDEVGLESFIMRRELLEVLLQKLRSLSLEQIAALPGMQEGRQTSILAGAMLCMKILEHSGKPEFKLSTKGWRHALVYRLSQT